jgi:autotransporter-associated beta strand protein
MPPKPSMFSTVRLMTAVASVFLPTTAALAQRADTFNASSTYQTIDHFGAHDSWTGQAYGAWSTNQRNTMSDALFSQSTGIGLSGWYVHLGAGVDSAISSQSYPWNLRTQQTFETGQGTYDWTRNDANQNILADAKARGVEKYMAVVYSPTLRMTNNGKPYPSASGNNLATGFGNQFATYMADVLEHFKNNPDASRRIDFDYISPLNEPQYNWSGGSQEGNGYLSQSVIRTQINTLYAELQARGLTTGIRSPESGKLQDLYSGQNYLSQLAGNAGVNTKLGNVISYHSYFSDSDTDMLARRQNVASAMASYPGWNLWQTEYCILGSNASSGLQGSGNDTSMTTALAVARTMHFDLTVANAAVWSYWLAATPWEHNYKDGLVYFSDVSQTFQVAKVGWAFAHYARFVRPGAQRIQFDGANNISGLLVSAWKDATKNDLTLVYVNQLTTNEVVNHTFNNTATLKADYFTPYLTTDNSRVNVQAQTQFLIGQDYTIPARSMVSLVSGTFNEDNTGKLFPAIVGSRNYTLGGGMLTLLDGAGTYAGVMSGAGGFIKRGVNTMTLTGNNAYTGDTVVEEGTLALGGTANLSVGRIGKDSLIIIKNAGTVRVDYWNALGGYTPANAPAVRVETGGVLTTSNGFQANLGQITLAGGTLASGTPSSPYGSWTLNRDMLVTGNLTSVMSANDVQVSGSRQVIVDAGATLDVTGSFGDIFGATSGTLVKAGPGVMKLARSTVDNINVQAGTVRLNHPDIDVGNVLTKSLSVSAGATLDLHDDRVYIDYATASPVASLEVAAADGRVLTSFAGKTIAVVDNARLGDAAFDATTVILRAALAGDADLNGLVNFNDLLTLAQSYQGVSDGWLDGDFDYSGTVDFNDLLSLAQNYGGGAVQLANGVISADWALAQSLVPEPGLLACTAALSASLARRRRYR